MPAVSTADGPVVVTGASGFVGSHVVLNLLARGFSVRACVTDADDPARTAHLVAMDDGDHPGSLSIHEGNLLEEASYDLVVAGAVGLFHVGTAMGYGGANSPQQVYDAAVDGTANLMRSVRRAGGVRRVVYTSSFAAIANPRPPGYVFTEADWASDNRERDRNGNPEKIDENGEVA